MSSKVSQIADMKSLLKVKLGKVGSQTLLKITRLDYEVISGHLPQFP